MRYADSGGLSPAARAKREALRLEAGEAFEAGEGSKSIAERLRVTRKSVNDWRRGPVRPGDVQHEQRRTVFTLRPVPRPPRLTRTQYEDLTRIRQAVIAV